MESNKTLQKPHSHKYILNNKMGWLCGSKMILEDNGKQSEYTCIVLIKIKRIILLIIWLTIE